MAHRRRASRTTFTLVLLAVLSILFLLALNSPSFKIPTLAWLAEHGLVERHVFILAHRLLHLLGFAAAGFVLFSISRSWRQALASLLLLLATAVLTEAIQFWTFRIRFEWWDVRDDFIGIVFAILCRWMFRNRKGSLS